MWYWKNGIAQEDPCGSNSRMAVKYDAWALCMVSEAQIKAGAACLYSRLPRKHSDLLLSYRHT